MYGDGGVHVLYGTARGLTAIGGEFWSRRSKGVGKTSRSTDRFGSALAAGDLNGDGDAELAVGVPGAGVVLVLAGTRTGGLTARHRIVLRGRSRHPGDMFGSSVGLNATGLVVGAPGAGRVTVVPAHARRGSYTGLRPSAAHPLSGPPRTLFGYTLS